MGGAPMRVTRSDTRLGPVVLYNAQAEAIRAGFADFRRPQAIGFRVAVRRGWEAAIEINRAERALAGLYAGDARPPPRAVSGTAAVLRLPRCGSRATFAGGLVVRAPRCVTLLVEARRGAIVRRFRETLFLTRGRCRAEEGPS
jgi:hypothetical protein